MMNATAVLPASAAMAFAGNAATISDSVISDNSAPGGFSEMLGAMVSGSRQSAGKSADTPATKGQTAMPGEILSGLTELEQSAEELKQLLRTAELAGYMQAAVVQTANDAPAADNAEFMRVSADNESMQSVVQTMVQNGTDRTDVRQVGGSSVQISQISEIMEGKAPENDFAETARTILAENTDIGNETVGVSEDVSRLETIDIGYIADEGIRNRDIGAVTEETVRNGHLAETDIMTTAYRQVGSAGDASITAGHTAIGKPEENAFTGESVYIADMSKPGDVAVEGKSDSVSVEGKSDSVSVEGKSDSVSVEGKSDSVSVEGKPDSVSAEGKSDSVSVEGKSDSVSVESKPEVIAVVDRYDNVATDDKSKAVDLSAAGKTYNAETDAVTVAEPQKDIAKMTFEKTVGNVTGEAKQEAAAQADNIPRVAYAKRNIEVKSEELKAITKGNEAAKSDSDLDAVQKVTDKNAVSDMSARSADVFARTESRFDDNGQPTQTVRVPISDMASFVSERAPKSTGRSTLTVVLTPETLGKITVRMVNESGKLTVEILTETQAAKELLQAKSEQLAYALRNDNVELTSYKVETSQTELFQRDFDGSSKNPYRQRSNDRQKDDTDDFDSLLGEIQAMD